MMANLFGRNWTREELLSYVGDIQQIGGVRRFALSEGRQAGVEIAQFRTGTGFNFDVVLSRALDISMAEYRGQPLAWRSSTGDVGPWYYEPEGQGWLRSFSGGLLATCGLRNIGPACVDEGKHWVSTAASATCPLSIFG